MSGRFWPFLVLVAMWFHFLFTLQLHRSVGGFVIMMRMAVNDLSKFLVLWFISLTFFAWVTIVWLGNFEEYSTFMRVIQSLYLTSLGLLEQPQGLAPHREVGFHILHTVFIVVNLIGFISFLTAMMTYTLVESQTRLISLKNGYFVSRLPTERFNDKIGWITTSPLLLAPFSLLICFPFWLLNKKLAKSRGATVYNTIVCVIYYLPVFLA